MVFGDNGVRKTGHKRARVAKFRGRHADQIWVDASKAQSGNEVIETTLGQDKKPPIRHGPYGTLDGVELDEDIPGLGKHYCIPCSRYFISKEAQETHSRTKLHKKNKKKLFGKDGTMKQRPHRQVDADIAAGKAATDNGPTTSMKLDKSDAVPQPEQPEIDFGEL
mmetsp:Transcript_2836/g.6850  ORF Transcript_2836/g.6850 Transcript_2836/m.6850 type:complete len:165 (-) Transcript_2836:1180-1674(-)|eukprot:CAMPEP_0198238204 /NCGR_PEP_ID=MMETSP1446-20131203/3919_1 /TAXON_ID=1461542 ORGANISM="Unidentified sp, Strain CCMP2111" /NCGR_SAMPLE_ID=MMETSP1446 /ASSEMBLY_ACC=CAM_ASM_001112 /LENGTH=164 /DNA_ID=CAMNT_0043920573 /DNA_START=81 /DNA_END=575 /DNA_ORIENTATION=+